MRDVNFKQLVNKVTDNGNPAKVKELARLMKVSIPTVERWVSGKSEPHRFMKKHIVKDIIKKYYITKQNLILSSLFLLPGGSIIVLGTLIYKRLRKK